MISAVVVYEHEEIELEKNDGSVNQEILLQPFEPICFVLGIFCWLFSAELSPREICQSFQTTTWYSYKFI